MKKIEKQNKVVWMGTQVPRFLPKTHINFINLVPSNMLGFLMLLWPTRVKTRGAVMREGCSHTVSHLTGKCILRSVRSHIICAFTRFFFLPLHS